MKPHSRNDHGFRQLFVEVQTVLLDIAKLDADDDAGERRLLVKLEGLIQQRLHVDLVFDK